MTFISYAQNYEDVMLWRALQHVENGFYVDVGAMDPVFDSVTYAFYQRGWRGINIEPIRHWYDKLTEDRPEDMNLNVAISDQPGVLCIYDVQDTGLSTSDKDIAEKHSRELGVQHKEIMVPALTLDSVLQEFNREIHFLKVDVEGAEKQVLASIDLTRIKPWIILVEATKPSSQEQNFEAWEGILIDSGYTFVYFDGLNRFYVSPDKKDIIAAFDSPPNVFDGFMTVHYENAIEEREMTQAQLNEVSVDREQIRKQFDEALVNREQIQKQLDEVLVNREQIRKQLDEVWADREQIRKQLDEVWTDRERIYQSRSWKVTAPLRVTLITVRTWRNRFFHLRNRFFSSLVLKFKETIKTIIWRLVMLVKKVFRFIMPGVYVRLANNEKLRHIYSRILRPRIPVSGVSISQINNFSPVVLETDFPQKFQHAVGDWRLGERVDD